MKECVLLVDDCDALRRSIGEYLSMFGLHLISVGTLQEALATLTFADVHTVVTDLQLGHRRAHALIHASCDQGVNTIITSALALDGIRKSIGPSLVDKVWILEKPYDLSRLRRLITLGQPPHSNQAALQSMTDWTPSTTSSTC